MRYLSIKTVSQFNPLSTRGEKGDKMTFQTNFLLANNKKVAHVVVMPMISLSVKTA